MPNYVKMAAALAAAAGLPSLLRRFKKRGSLTMLSLHRVSPETDYFWQPLHPDRFAALCAYARRHYEVVNLRDLAMLPPPRKSSKPRLVLSFDDGYHDFIEYALPILQQHELPANHNLVVACLDDNYPIWSQRLNYSFALARDREQALTVTVESTVFTLVDAAGDWMTFYLRVLKNLLTQTAEVRETALAQLEAAVGEKVQVRMMNWADAQALADYNIEVGSHTYSHEVIPTLTDPAALRRELVESRRVLAARLGQPIGVLGLPNGQNARHLQPYLLEAGYDYVLETGNRGNATYRRPATGPACFRRINIVDEPPALARLRLEALALKK